MHGGLGVGHAELDDDADADGDLVGRQDLLALDRQLALADVDQGHLDARRAIEAEVDVTRQGVPARAQDPGEDPILVVEAPVGILDDDLATGHPRSPPAHPRVWAPKQSRCAVRASLFGSADPRS